MLPKERVTLPNGSTSLRPSGVSYLELSGLVGERDPMKSSAFAADRA